MKDRPHITALVCERHCRFYRPGRVEELSCEGYHFFRDRLTEDTAAEISRFLAAADPSAPAPADPRVEHALCRLCVFREQDCDFQSREKIPGATPCGGYLLLCRLLAAGFPSAETWLKTNASEEIHPRR